MPTPTLQIYSAIGYDATTGTGLSADAFGAMLAGAEASGERRVAVRINSGGGNWAEGQSMYDMLSASPLKVDTYCVGLVASAATLPFMAGDKRYISAHGRLMIHNCASGAIGGVTDLENAIAQQHAINGSMAALYAARSGQSVEDCAAMMAATTFLTAEQALALGFATAICDDDKKTQAPPAALLATASGTASLHAYYANLLSSPTSDMKNLLLPVFAAAGVKLSATASDDDVAKAVATAFADADEARAAFKKAKADADDARAAADDSDAKAKAAQAALADFEAKAKADDEMAAKAKVVALVDGAIATGKITAGLKDSFVALATADFTAASAALNGLTGRKSVVEYTAAYTPTADTTAAVPLSAAGAMGEIQARLGSR